MGKIELCGKEYELPKVTFATMADLGELGLKISSGAKEENFFKTVIILTAYITNTDKDKASAILDEAVTDGGKFVEITSTLTNWLYKSDFFQKMQANLPKAKK